MARHKDAASAGLIAIILLLSAGSSIPAERSRSVRAAFQREHPCPSTGKLRGACPGYVVDHMVPLCAGGPDDPANMQWQTIQAAKEKDAFERRECRRIPRQ